MPNILDCYTNAFAFEDGVPIKVVVHMQIRSSFIIYPKGCVDQQKAECTTRVVECVCDIFNKNDVRYEKAVDIYKNDDFTYLVGESLKLDKPIKIYLNLNVCNSKNLVNKIKTIVKYNEKGELIMNGICANGLFTGKTFDDVGKTTIIKNGIVVDDG
jgi:hypothetical protein